MNKKLSTQYRRIVSMSGLDSVGLERIRQKHCFSPANLNGFYAVQRKDGMIVLRYIYQHTQKVKSLNVDIMDYEPVEVETQKFVDAFIDTDRQLVRFEGQKSGIKRLLDALSEIENTELSTQPLVVNLYDACNIVRGCWSAPMVKSFKIKEYVDKEGMQANVMFKPTHQETFDAFVGRYLDGFAAVQIDFGVDENSRFSVSLTKNSDIKVSGDFPDDVLENIVDALIKTDVDDKENVLAKEQQESVQMGVAV